MRVEVHFAWGPPGVAPAGAPERPADARDLMVVTALGPQFLLRDLERGLAEIPTRPVLMRRRVLIIDGAERLREQEGAERLLKTLEEPPPLSHILLVTDNADKVKDTLRSRCLPVPFRPPGWRTIAAHLEAEGATPAAAAGRAPYDT